MSTTRSTEHLTTGWESDLPPEDTELRRFVLAWSEALAGPVAAEGGRVTRTPGVMTADLTRPASYYSSAVLLQPPTHGRWEETLDHIEHTMFGDGTGQVHLYSPWPTPDLTARGWRLEGHPPLLFRPPGGTLPEVTPGLVAHEVADPEELRAWERIVVEAYPLPDLLPWRPGVLFTERVLSSGLRMWIGYVDGEPVGAAASFVAHGLHVLSIGVVHPDARGHGYWRSLLGTRLAAYPGLPSASLFSDMSRPGAQRHGFWPISRFTLWTRDRS